MPVLEPSACRLFRCLTGLPSISQAHQASFCCRGSAKKGSWQGQCRLPQGELSLKNRMEVLGWSRLTTAFLKSFHSYSSFGNLYLRRALWSHKSRWLWKLDGGWESKTTPSMQPSMVRKPAAWVDVPLSQLCCAQSSPTFCNPMDGSPPGSSIHGISQASIL